ncbi:hypothetical protein ONE63_006827 [Megalurothrips usitatus]|uniref:Uncharacterized protein n=1 Tax=Megalurothrips usitatus TaxID=439358 RepID=A0AAV7XTL7_9NEOP|nr:hypothetical protein ONE63_006827 [Megalurothrips usitatus]
MAALAAAATAHEVVLPSSFGVLPQPLAPLPPLPPPLLYRTGLGLDLDVPVVLPGVPVSDHVTPVLRAGAPAILLLPQTSSSGVYHLSDTHHQFPPFLENVVNRVQNLFSSYVQVDPFNVPFATSRPTAPALLTTPTAATATAPPAGTTASPGDGSTAAITTTTTTTTTARTHGRGINVRLLAGGPAGSGPSAPNLPRDVELLDGRLQQQRQQQVATGAGPGQPVAFASATAQVHQPDGDSYLPANNNNNKGGGNGAVDERPPPLPRPEDRPYGSRGQQHPQHRGRAPQRPSHSPADASYYRRP